MTEPGYPVDPLTWRSNRRLEQHMVKRCARAVFTTAGTLQMYAERYPEVEAKRWSIIENGYDEENFKAAETGMDAAPLGTPGQVTLLHSGILYPAERDPRPFFAALRGLKAAGEVSAATLRVRLRATGSDGQYVEMLKTYGIEDLVELAPSVAYRPALQEMLRADGLLLFQAAMCNHQIPAKLYEYLRAGRPVLTLTDPIGNTAEAMRTAGVDDIVDINNEASITAGLRRFLAALRAGQARGASPEVASLNSRRARTAELAKLLDEVAREPRR
jgi:glycosyltransferase involved in cell wall biosynthesis